MKRIGLLILTYENPLFPDNIIKYTEDYNINLYIHPKSPDKVNNYFKKSIIKNLVPTKWGDMSLVTATINLLEAAYKECDYFYLISGDTFIINKMDIFDLSCFDFIKKYNEFYKTSQWWGLNKKDAEVIIKTKNKYLNYFINKNINGAYDENYFLTVLYKENSDYKYILKNIMYVKWIDNVISKHPFVFNKLTINDMYLSRNSFFIRKCLYSFKYKKHIANKNLFIFYIGTETKQNDILKINFTNSDYIIITAIDINTIHNDILKNTYYIIPIIWKFYNETVKSLSKDITISSWENIIFFPEIFDYTLVQNYNFLNIREKYCTQNKILTLINNSPIKFTN
jgi:hypothetical protein